jgi:hypothetical protein
VRVLLVALLVVLAVGGCGTSDDELARPVATTTLPPEIPTDLVDLPVGTADVGPGDRVRAGGGILRVNRRAVDLAPVRVDAVAVVEGGVFFRNGLELWFTDLDRAQATGYADARSVVASDDGRRIAFLDMQHGPKDRFGTPLAIVVAYDATTGKPLVASYAGMGDPLEDDLADLYEDSQPEVLRVEDDAVLVQGATGGDYLIPLDGSNPERIG